jgi:UDP-N-acetylmuramyl pentapeptide phosphotransferase/UDP-N-acetylglucosamine-1-phosphate transferase
VNRGLSAVGSWLEQAGALPVGLRQWVLRYRPWLQGVVVLAFVVATLLWSPHTAKVEIWLAIIGVVVLAIIGIVRSRTREELADLVERRERAAAAREEEQQAAVAAAALNEPVAAGSIGPAPDEDPTKGTA